MIQLGVINRLKINRSMPQGLYLQSLDDEEEVLLPNRYVTEEMEIGDELEVFVYTDSEDRVVAITDEPYVKLHEFAYLECTEVTDFGAFLDWGLDKDLFVPFKNQAVKMQEGQGYIIYVYEDEDSDRLVGTSKYSKFFNKNPEGLNPGDEVDLLIEYKTDLGVKVIVNNQYMGLVFHNEIFKKLMPGKEMKGYVKAVRSDGKLDITLEPLGVESIEPNAQRILSYLRMNQGTMNLTDKSDPELIKTYLQMSKKNFKKAVGSLYKQRLIEIEDECIKLLSTTKK